jgi:dihydroorotase-like cyclic amidohydrolase
MYMVSRQLVNWDMFAALLSINPAERVDIRYSLLYPNNHSKAEKVEEQHGRILASDTC